MTYDGRMDGLNPHTLALSLLFHPSTCGAASALWREVPFDERYGVVHGVPTAYGPVWVARLTGGDGVVRCVAGREG
jgi:hypothetical protein